MQIFRYESGHVKTENDHFRQMCIFIMHVLGRVNNIFQHVAHIYLPVPVNIKFVQGIIVSHKNFVFVVLQAVKLFCCERSRKKFHEILKSNIY